MKKVLVLFVPALGVGAYTAFVAMCMWNWFAVSALHVSEITYFQMLGLMWLINLFTINQNKDEIKWQTLLITVDYCVPDEKREAVNADLKEFDDNTWMLVGGQIIGTLIASTLTLILGFILYHFTV